MANQQRREIKSVHIYAGTDDSALLEACYILITARRARLAEEVEKLRKRVTDLEETLARTRQELLETRGRSEHC